MNFTKHRFFYPIILILLIILATFFRFYNLQNIGPISYDEGRYLYEAFYTKEVLTWSAGLVWDLAHSTTKASLINEYVNQFNLPEQPFRTARPLHNIITSIGLFFSSSLNTGNFIIAFLGVVNVFLTFVLAILITNSKKVALVSAALLSILPSQVFYSRLVIAEIDSQFFFLLALIFYIQRIKKNQSKYWLLTSVFITAAFLTNGNRFAFITPLIVELILYQRKAIKNIIIFFLVLVGGIFIAEIPYHLAYLLTHNYNLVVTNPSFLEQQLWLYTRVIGFGAKFNFYSILSYPYMLASVTGLLFMIFFILGLIKVVRIKDKPYLAILIILSATLIFQTFHSLQALRAISPIIPLITLFSALGIFYLISKITVLFKGRLAAFIISVVIILTFFELVMKTIPIFGYTTPYPKLIDIIKKENVQSVVSTNDITLKAYLKNLQTYNYQLTLGTDDFSHFSENKPDLIITTVQKYTIPTKAINLTKKLNHTTTLIEENCTPLYSLTDINSPILLKFFTYEHNSSLDKTLDFINNFNDLSDANINVYQFEDCIKQLNSVKNI